MKKEKNLIYYGKKDEFYYIKCIDKQLVRNNKLSFLLDDEEEINYYVGVDWKPTTNLSEARFWKDEFSAEKAIRSEYGGVYNTKPRSDVSWGDIFKVIKINRDEFIQVIPESYSVENAITLRNSSLRSQEIKFARKLKEFRAQYKAISAYVKVDKPNSWLTCPNCGLIPLIWEFDNGRSTACGCGENEYRHHSVTAESIMSFVTRNNGSTGGLQTLKASGKTAGYNQDELRENWNHWVKTGVNLFEKRKEENNKLW